MLVALDKNTGAANSCYMTVETLSIYMNTQTVILVDCQDLSQIKVRIK